MLLATSLGISFANFAYDAALTVAATTSTLTNPAFMRINSDVKSANMAEALFAQAICVLAQGRKNTDHVFYGVPRDGEE